jgi:hypothetical protein
MVVMVESERTTRKKPLLFVIAIASLSLSLFLCVLFVFRFGELGVNGCTACVMQKEGNGRKKQERKPWSAEKVVVVVVVVLTEAPGMLLCGTVLRTLVQSSVSSAMASSSGSIAATAVAAAAPAAVVAVSHQHQQHQQRTLRGVVFDMDGTLTVPTIDFASMYRRVLGDDHPRIVSGSPIDILHEIAEWSPEKQVQAYAIIAEYEKQALERLQIMPGLSTSHLSSSSFTLRICCQKFL